MWTCRLQSKQSEWYSEDMENAFVFMWNANATESGKPVGVSATVRREAADQPLADNLWGRNPYFNWQ